MKIVAESSIYITNKNLNNDKIEDIIKILKDDCLKTIQCEGRNEGIDIAKYICFGKLLRPELTFDEMEEETKFTLKYYFIDEKLPDKIKE